MIELFEQNERKADRQSSKGNQLKWENNGIWYKADCTGYEGLAEYMISHLLKFSSLQKDEFVLYDYERIKYKNIFYNGVKSNNFLYDDWQIITLERLFHNFFHFNHLCYHTRSVQFSGDAGGAYYGIERFWNLFK